MGGVLGQGKGSLGGCAVTGEASGEAEIHGVEEGRGVHLLICERSAPAGSGLQMRGLVCLRLSERRAPVVGYAQHRAVTLGCH